MVKFMSDKKSSQSIKQSYDVVVIGAGNGGLVATARLAYLFLISKASIFLHKNYDRNVACSNYFCYLLYNINFVL
jgi:ribulose 1,5-bisphosphate synthetase/thiazole synthase